MISRREVVTGAAAVALVPAKGVLGMTTPTVMPGFLETRLFNFRDNADPAAIAKVVARMRALTGTPGVDSVLIGRNFVPDPFPARFEWVSMIQFNPATTEQWAPYQAICAELARTCRNQVASHVQRAFAPGFGSAPGVGVRHTVMFDFRPDASPADQVRNVDAIREMGKLPMVQAYQVEPNAFYPGDPTQMQWQVIGDFANVADYRAYAAAPVHLAIRDDFKAHTARVAFLDVKI
jgi:hypothetical protein